MKRSPLGPAGTRPVNRQRTYARLFLLQLLVLALMATLFARLWYLQVAAGDRYERAASHNRVREVVTPAVRGLLLDDVGRPLVRNRTRLVVSVSRTELERQPDGGAAVLGRLAAVLRRPSDALRKQIRPCARGVPKPCWNGSPYQPVPLADDADVATALQILERRDRFPGVSAEFVAAREYPSPEGANAAHVLGYLQPADEAEMTAQRSRGLLDWRLQRADLVGRAGLEKQYDTELRGVPGVQRVAVDHRGRVTGTVGETPSRPGNHIVTTIDAKVQAVAEQQLQAAIKRARTVPDFRGRRYRADSGAVVVLDVNTGAVVAMASYPTYDPSVWVGGISGDAYARLTGEQAGIPLLSRAFQGGGPPGSTFKVISTAAAGESGYSLRARYPCPSSFTVGNRSFKNFESLAYGAITLRRAIEVSCDTVFYRIAYSMWRRDGGNQPDPKPKDPMQTMARAFGLGRLTGVDLPGESPGRIADRAYKQRYWAATKAESCRRAETGYPDLRESDPLRARFLELLAKENCAEGYRFRAGDAVNFAIGQGDTMVTPLQLANVYAAIANGGTLWKPYVAKAELTPQGRVVRTVKPARIGRLPVSPQVLGYLQESLEGVSRAGTAAGVFRGFPLDEYTVGAKTGTAEAFGKQPSSWFATYAGKGGKPQYAIVMTVSQGGTGSGTSGPSVRKIYEAIFGIGQPAALPGGRPPSRLPVVRKDGTIQVVR
jgi:penicillin-binding protein 2